MPAGPGVGSFPCDIPATMRRSANSPQAPPLRKNAAKILVEHKKIHSLDAPIDQQHQHQRDELARQKNPDRRSVERPPRSIHALHLGHPSGPKKWTYRPQSQRHAPLGHGPAACA